MCPTKKLWSCIKSRKQDFCGIGTLHVEGKTLTNSQDMADALNNFFASVFTHEDLSSWPYLNEDNSFPDMPPIHIHPHGVEQLLSGLKLHKASGPDMIPTYLLKLLAHQLAPALTVLYQASLDQGQLAEDWKTANVLPIFKKGN